MKPRDELRDMSIPEPIRVTVRKPTPWESQYAFVHSYSKGGLCLPPSHEPLRRYVHKPHLAKLAELLIKKGASESEVAEMVKLLSGE